MLVTFCVCLLLAAAHGQQQQLDDTYLPPGQQGGYTPQRQCPPARTITSYSDRLVVNTQTQIVSRPVVQYFTQTSVSRRVVPSLIVRTSVYRSTVVVPQEVVRTSNIVRYQTSTITEPGAVREVVRTQEQVVRSTQLIQLTTTLERTQLRTSIQYRTQTRTTYVTRTQFVPQVSVYTQRQTVPGPNVVVTQTKEVLRTSVVTQPSQPIVSTIVQQQVRYETQRVPVPGAVRTSTVVQQSQQVIPVQSEVVVPQRSTIRVTHTRRFERTLFKTYTSQQVIPVYATSTNVVNSRIVRTQQVQVTSTALRVNTDFVTVTDPPREVVSVVRNTNINFVTLPGKVIPVVRTETVEQIVNREVVSTKVVPNIVVRTEFVDLPCKSGGGSRIKSQGGFAAPLGGSSRFGGGLGGGIVVGHSGGNRGSFGAGGLRGQSGRSYGGYGTYGRPYKY